MQKDEHYILELCDAVLGLTALRQYRFDFLLGDKNSKGQCRRLPVDGFYSSISLAIEYRERQHTEAVAIMDRRITISGCSRGEQRRIYDERRRTVLPRHGIRLVELDYSLFTHDRKKRLLRDAAMDEAVVRRQLSPLTTSQAKADDAN